METKENFSSMDILRQINQSILVLSQNQALIFEQYKSLSDKIDFNYAELNKKVDFNSSHITKIEDTVVSIQKDIINVRTDIDTVYALENDSRKKIQRLL